MNSHLLPLFISYRSSGEKLIKISNKFSSCDHVHNSHDHSFYKELLLKGEIWCWSLLGLKGLISKELRCTSTPWEESLLSFRLNAYLFPTQQFSFFRQSKTEFFPAWCNINKPWTHNNYAGHVTSWIDIFQNFFYPFSPSWSQKSQHGSRAFFSEKEKRMIILIYVKPLSHQSLNFWSSQFCFLSSNPFLKISNLLLIN